MTTESKPKLTGSLHLHARGPVFASVAHLADTPDKPYAVIQIGLGSGTEAVIFPDAEALDSLMAGIMQVRAEIRRRTGQPVHPRRVVRIGDDSPCPVTAEVLHDASDPDYVWVRWMTAEGVQGPAVREPRDELMFARRDS